MTENQPKQTPNNIYGPSKINIADVFKNPSPTAIPSTNSSNIFGKSQQNKQEGEGLKKPQNVQAQNNQKIKNIFESSSSKPNVFQAKPVEQNLDKKQANLSLQPNQSNALFDTKINADQKPFTLQRQEPSTGQASISFENSIATEQKKGGLFVSTGTQNKKGGLFDKKQTGESTKNIGIFETRQTLESNTKQKPTSQDQTKKSQEALKNSEQQQEVAQISEQKQADPSIIKQEGSQQERISADQKIEEKEQSPQQLKRKEIIRYLQKVKENNQEISLLPKSKSNEYFQRQIELIEKNIETLNKENIKIKDKKQGLEQQKKDKEDKIKQLHAQKNEDFSFKKIIESSHENYPIKTYPNQDMIREQISSLTSMIQNFYISGQCMNDSGINQGQNPQKELISLRQNIDVQKKAIQFKLRQQKLSVDANSEDLRKIQYFQSFGKYMNIAENEKKSEAQGYLEQKTRQLKEQLRKLRGQNEEKRKVFEDKRSQLRNYSPPQKIAEGRSSIIMKSTIFD